MEEEEEGENVIESFDYLMADNCLRSTDSVIITNVIFQDDIQTKIKKLMADGVQELNSKNLVNYYGDKLKEMLKNHRIYKLKIFLNMVLAFIMQECSEKIEIL